MNTLHLKPTDVLFFRDGRPMGGSLSGHGAAWPLPTVTNAALHAALHRAKLVGMHGHDHHRRDGTRVSDARKFGSLLTAGPFPVLKNGEWLFPRPLDTGVTEKTGTQPERDSTAVTFLPLAKDFRRAFSSLPRPLQYPVSARLSPTKVTPSPWWTGEAWHSYLEDWEDTDKALFHKDTVFCETEHTYGIGMDPDTGTQDGERFYSAHYLRLKPDCRLGLVANAKDKDFRDDRGNDDLIAAIFPNSGAETPIIVGGQQRLCTVERHNTSSLPLPIGKCDGFRPSTMNDQESWLVKWVLLTPAIFPGITAGTSKRGTPRKAHPGGWLPTWICPDTGKVLLETVDEKERKRRRSLNALGRGYSSNPNIDAQLVAALVGKPIPVTGYALPHEAAEQKGGAKATHLAVPAGSVYYFACENEDAAKALANALNWHVETGGAEIRNRRSTLFGEKGFGLGVCGAWEFHDGKLPEPQP